MELWDMVYFFFQNGCSAISHTQKPLEKLQFECHLSGSFQMHGIKGKWGEGRVIASINIPPWTTMDIAAAYGGGEREEE